MKRLTTIGRPITMQQVRAGFAGMERRWTRELKARAANERRLHEAQTRYYRPLLELLAEDKRSASAQADLHRAAQIVAGPRTPVPRLSAGLPASPVGYLARMLPPPFDHSYSWQSSNSPIVQLSADQQLGRMSLSLKTLSHGPPSLFAGWVALGVSFQPTTGGLLQISADPAYTAWVGVASGQFPIGLAQGELWMDMWVDRYSMSGAFDARIVDQTTTLLRLDTSHSQALGQPLVVPAGAPNDHRAGVAALVGVDPGHKYVLWIWCGGLVSGQGGTNVWYDSANVSMDVSVPSLNVS